MKRIVIAALLALAEDRLQPIGGYVLKLAQPVRFKIVRALS